MYNLMIFQVVYRYDLGKGALWSLDFKSNLLMNQALFVYGKIGSTIN